MLCRSSLCVPVPLFACGGATVAPALHVTAAVAVAGMRRKAILLAERNVRSPFLARIERGGRFPAATVWPRALPNCIGRFGVTGTTRRLDARQTSSSCTRCGRFNRLVFGSSRRQSVRSREAARQVAAFNVRDYWAASEGSRRRNRQAHCLSSGRRFQRSRQAPQAARSDGA